MSLRAELWPKAATKRGNPMFFFSRHCEGIHRRWTTVAIPFLTGGTTSKIHGIPTVVALWAPPSG